MSRLTNKLKPVEMGRAEKLLLNTGLLFAINYLILHPLGLALAFSYKSKKSRVPTHILLMECKPPLTFAPDTLQEALDKLDKFLHKGTKIRGHGDLYKLLNDIILKRSRT